MTDRYEALRAALAAGPTPPSMSLCASVADYFAAQDQWDAYIASAFHNDIAALLAERDALRSFARKVMAEHPEASPDGFELQDYAVKCGVLVAVRVTEPCDENCHCAEYHGTADMSEGVECFRLADFVCE